MSKKTLIIAPHPDDETIGCGGLILRRKHEGSEVAWLIVTSISEKGGWDKEKVIQRKEEIKSVEKLYGFDAVYNLDFPSIELDQIPMKDLIQAISKVFKEFEPKEVFIPHCGDIHSDHRIVFDAATACTKWFRYPSISSLFAYETASETEFNHSRGSAFHPNVYFDITNYLKLKLEILKIYESELGDYPFPRSIKSVQALAEWRGSNSGFASAEAFDLLLFRE
jgi:N-acetylglucosamine malate deacetylase 1